MAWVIITEEKFDVGSLDLMKHVARQMAEQLGRKSIVLLSGDLGAGKTQFVKFVLESLGCKETASPSFSLENIYQTRLGPVKHFDLYRLETEDDIESSGFWDSFLEPNIVFVEWSERISMESLPKDWRVFSILLKFDGSARQLRWINYAAKDLAT